MKGLDDEGLGAKGLWVKEEGRGGEAKGLCLEEEVGGLGVEEEEKVKILGVEEEEEAAEGFG